MAALCVSAAGGRAAAVEFPPLLAPPPQVGVDYFALSFVRDEGAVLELKRYLASKGGWVGLTEKKGDASASGTPRCCLSGAPPASPIPSVPAAGLTGTAAPSVIAKIESADSVTHLEAILDSADGAMVRRLVMHAPGVNSSSPLHPGGATWEPPCLTLLLPSAPTPAGGARRPGRGAAGGGSTLLADADCAGVPAPRQALHRGDAHAGEHDHVPHAHAVRAAIEPF